MGLLATLLGSPAQGLMFVLEQTRREVDRELYDETLWQQKLLDLQMRFELGEINQAQFEAQEDAVMAQLDLIQSLNNPFEDEDEESDEDEDEESDEDEE